VSDEEIQQVTADNLDVACQVIEKVATDKAILEIDNSLASAYEARRRHREVSDLAYLKLIDKQPDVWSFYDPISIPTAHFGIPLPWPLRITPECYLTLSS
jgi:CCR4-NOT transcription complex subunit 1